MAFRLSKLAAIPGRVKAALIGGLVITALAGGFTGWVYWKGRQAAEADVRPQIEAAQDRQWVAEANAKGVAVAAEQDRAYYVNRSRAEAVVHDFDLSIPEIMIHEPLDADRLARLRDADRELCNIRPSLVGCPPAD